MTTELVIRQLSDWIGEGLPVRPVAINYSSLQLSDEGYPDFLAAMLKKYKVPAELVEIEITESVFIGESQHANDLFDRFKAMGLSLHLDDFGTGYSSLGYLSYIPADIIKLDKSLVDTYLMEGKDQFIGHIIHLIHDLGKKIIVEGVEDQSQIERLKRFGADIIQDYVYSKPLPPEEAIRFRL